MHVVLLWLLLLLQGVAALGRQLVHGDGLEVADEILGVEEVAGAVGEHEGAAVVGLRLGMVLLGRLGYLLGLVQGYAVITTGVSELGTL